MPTPSRTSSADGDLRVAGLRLARVAEPLGLEPAPLELSWRLASAGRGARQSAYQIVVADRPEALTGDGPPLWDSGRVASASSSVRYGGPGPAPARRYHWRVRVWDADGRPSAWSEPVWWETGLRPEDWQAAWIGPEDPPGDEPAPPAYLRRAFDVGAEVAEARVYATALGLYQLYCNGVRVGDHELAPGWTDYDRRVRYQTYDVTGLLHPGQNVLGAVLADGWYAGHVASFGRRRYGAAPRLLMQLRLSDVDGRVQQVVSDGSWRLGAGPLTGADLIMGERYDARREQPGWAEADFEASGWAPAPEHPEPAALVEAQQDPPVRLAATLTPTEVRARSGGRWIVDLGQNMVGRVRLRLSGPAGTTVTMRHAEMLDEHGELYTDNLRTAAQTDVYTMRGGEEVYEPHFTFHGFRYVEVHGYPGELGADALQGRVLTSALPETGSFSCSDPLVNQVQRNIVWGQRGNFVSVPTDCPQRDERLGWSGDVQIFADTAAFNMDVSGFFAKWLTDLRDAQRADGAFPDYAPHGGRLRAGSAGWGDAGVTVPWLLYVRYGDRRSLEAAYPAMARWIDYLRAESDRLLRPDSGYGDWLSLEAPTPKDLIGTAFFAHAAATVGKVATALGRDADADGYRELAAEVKDAFAAAYVDGDGSVRGGTQTGYLLALRFGLLPESLRPAAVQRLVADIAARDEHLATGFLGTPHLLPVLSDHGHHDLACRLARKRSYPSWGYEVEQGATTIWERWDGWRHDVGFQTPRMNSFNHYGFGSVGDWLYRYLAGLDFDERHPGARQLIVRPRPGEGLHAARAVYDSVLGRALSDWELSDGRLRLDVAVPVGASATVHVPAADPAAVTEGGAAAVEAAGVEPLDSRDGRAVFRVASGSYRFEADA